MRETSNKIGVCYAQLALSSGVRRKVPRAGQNIGVARGGKVAMPPQIFRKIQSFCALRDVFLNKIVLFA